MMMSTTRDGNTYERRGCPGRAGAWPGPRTVIVIHPRERRAKCSVEPLRKCQDFEFFTFPQPVTIDLSNYVQLGMGGPALSVADVGRGLLLLDGTWRRAERMAPFYRHVSIRTLPPILTAYPRKSSVFADPPGGLATIEALYAACRMLGRPTQGLLDHYRWKERFLELNGWERE
jgi:pre-rRNA-processing protein TSR3